MVLRIIVELSIFCIVLQFIIVIYTLLPDTVASVSLFLLFLFSYRKQGCGGLSRTQSADDAVRTRCPGDLRYLTKTVTQPSGTRSRNSGNRANSGRHKRIPSAHLYLNCTKPMSRSRSSTVNYGSRSLTA